VRTIPLKETLEVEFKSDKKRYPDTDLVEAVVGMANTNGGVLYLGVEDNGDITGVNDCHKDEIGVVALIANNTVPSVSTRAELLFENNMWVLKIEIPMSKSIVSTSTGKILRRRLKLDGTPENIPMYAYEINSRLTELSLLDISVQPLAGATLEDLDNEQRNRLRRIIKASPSGEKNLLQLSDEELDKALRIVVNENGKMVPSVTGMLLIGKDEKIAELMPTVKASFQVLEGTEVRLNEEFTKPLLETFEIFETFMKAWNPEREMEYGLFRFAIPEFDNAAFRESLVNAFCHRDYTMLGNVRVQIDDEGMTVSNPGGFIDGINLKNLLTVEPHGRNPALADALKRIGLAEKTGRGIDRIFEGSINYGRPWPDYSESTSKNVKLFIARAKADLGFIKMLADEQNKRRKSLSIYALMILSAIQNERRITLDRIVELTNLSEAKLRPTVEKLVEDGLIEQFGRGNSRSFVLNAKLYRSSKENIKYVRQTGIDDIRYSELILKLAKTQGGFITKSDVVDLLQVNANQAYELIRKLQKDGAIVLVQGGKYSKYKIVE